MECSEVEERMTKGTEMALDGVHHLVDVIGVVDFQ
jgi:hypothetical protein